MRFDLQSELKRRTGGFTSDGEPDSFADDRFDVDGAPVWSVVFEPDVLDLEVPVLDGLTNDTEAGIVDHSSVLERQRNRIMLQPGNLRHMQTYRSIYRRRHTETHTGICVEERREAGRQTHADIQTHL